MKHGVTDRKIHTDKEKLLITDKISIISSFCGKICSLAYHAVIPEVMPLWGI